MDEYHYITYTILILNKSIMNYYNDFTVTTIVISIILSANYYILIIKEDSFSSYFAFLFI